MSDDSEEHPHSGTQPPNNGDERAENGSVFSRLKTLIRRRPDPTLRETLEEYIEKPNGHHEDAALAHEKALLSNILQLRDLTVADVMLPRADIVALDVTTSQKELLELLAEKQHSRIPVYKDKLDDILGTIHIKDIVAASAKGQKIDIKDLIREAPIVSPAMRVLDLLLQMKESRKHMAMVVDEFGGIDGLVTVGDVIESIVGEIDDEYDPDDHHEIKEDTDGSILADARLDIEEFEERFGKILSDEEREESDTLGGLVFSLAGRVPARGEVLTHDSGMVFEVLDADPRRINQVRIRNIPNT